jgi:hypothetical protein
MSVCAPVESSPSPRRKARGPSVSDLKAQLASALAKLAEFQTRGQVVEAELKSTLSKLADAVTRAETAEAALLARPQSATPPLSGTCPEALLAPARGVIRIWVMTDAEGYRLRLIHLGADGPGWEFVKWSDGTRYHLLQADGDDIVCDCPGGAAHGPRCAGGKGCKHARFIRALRQLVNPAKV